MHVDVKSSLRGVDGFDALRAEEWGEREQDRAYWRPLKAELEHLRHAMRSDSKTTGEPQ